MKVTCRLLGVVLEESSPEELQVLISPISSTIWPLNSNLQNWLTVWFDFFVGRNKQLWDPLCWKYYWRSQNTVIFISWKELLTMKAKCVQTFLLVLLYGLFWLCLPFNMQNWTSPWFSYWLDFTPPVLLNSLIFPPQMGGKSNDYENKGVESNFELRTRAKSKNPLLYLFFWYV